MLILLALLLRMYDTMKACHGVIMDDVSIDDVCSIRKTACFFFVLVHALRAPNRIVVVVPVFEYGWSDELATNIQKCFSFVLPSYRQ
jgi:hypothetical protein